MFQETQGVAWKYVLVYFLALNSSGNCSSFEEIEMIRWQILFIMLTFLFSFIAMHVLLGALLWFTLTYFKSMFYFHTPWKHQKTSDLMFSGGIDWLKIGQGTMFRKYVFTELKNVVRLASLVLGMGLFSW